MEFRVMNLGGLNLQVSPFLQKEGDLLRCVNLDSDPYGAKRKRPGYNTLLGTTPNGSAILDMFSWRKEDGTSLFLYANAGGKLYSSTQGTGAWTICGLGTITAGAHMGHAVLADTLIVSQVGGTTMHTTSGTSFGTTVAAPESQYMCSSRDNRVYMGSASTLFYSASGSGTDWSTSGTSDSSSITIPGEGAINDVFFANDRVVVSKDSGLMYRWDGYNLYRVPTKEGPSSSQSSDELEDYWVYLNRNGYFGYSGDRPQVLSNSIQNQIRNNSGSAIVGTTFGTAPGVAYQMNYYCAVGTTTDEITGETISNCIQRYSFPYDWWDNYKLAHNPATWCHYQDVSGVKQLAFSNGNQAYQISGTATSDNGTAIESVLEGVLHFGMPETDKLYKKIRAFASPGCSAKFQVAFTDNFTKGKKNWIDVGNLNTGCTEMKFPANSRGKLLFYRLYESSAGSPFTFYGFTITADPIGE